MHYLRALQAQMLLVYCGCYFAHCGGQSITIRGAGIYQLGRIMESAFPRFLTDVGEMNNVTFEFRPLGNRASICRIIDPIIACTESDREDNGYIDVDVSVTTVQPSITRRFANVGITEPVEDVLSFPVAVLGVVAVVNLGHIIRDAYEDILLDVNVLADIFAGNITNWSDPRIAETLENAGRGAIAEILPNENITVVINTNSNDPTFLMRLFLSRYSETFPTSGGGLNTWYWLPNVIFRQGDDDVCGTVLLNEYTIALVPFALADDYQLDVANLRLGNGPILQPTHERIIASVVEAGVLFGYEEPGEFLVGADPRDNQGPYSWPLSIGYYIKLRTNSQGDRLRNGATCDNVRIVLLFLEWLMDTDLGRDSLNAPGIGVLPRTMSTFIMNYVKSQTMCNGTLAVPSPPDPQPLIWAESTIVACNWLKNNFSLTSDQNIQGMYRPIIRLASCKDNNSIRRNFPSDISMLVVPQLNHWNFNQGSFQAPIFLYKLIIIANLMSINGFGKEFIVTMDIVTQIFQGIITNWNDSQLTALNPGFQETDAAIVIVKICNGDDHSMVLKELLGIDVCSYTLPGEKIVEKYTEMEATIMVHPFSFGYLPHLDTDLEFGSEFNIAAFMTSSPSNSTEQTVVSVLDLADRIPALATCVEGSTLTKGTIEISHQKSPRCYPLTHALELLAPSEFSEETCRLSQTPSILYNYITDFILMLHKRNLVLDGIYTPYLSPTSGDDFLNRTLANLRASFKCGSEPLVTPDIYEELSVRIDTGSPTYVVCFSGVLLMSILMALTIVALSLSLQHPMIRSAGGKTLIVFIGFLFCKMLFTILLLHDPNQISGICILRTIIFLIGVTGSSAVLFFRMLSIYKIFKAKGVLKTSYDYKWVTRHVITVVLLVTVVVVPIFVIISEGKSSRSIVSEKTTEYTRFFISYYSTSVEYITKCDGEPIVLLMALSVQAIFLPANLILGVPLWAVDEKYSDARHIVFTSVMIIMFSVPNWSMYFLWRSDSYNNAVTLAAVANFCECVLMFFLFPFPRLFGAWRSGSSIHNQDVTKKGIRSSSEACQ